MRTFFRTDFSGAASSGAGALAFVDGKLAGIDVGGGAYTGSYSEGSDGVIRGVASLSFPSGGTLVTGAVVPPGAPPMSIRFVIKAGQLSGGFIDLDTPTGPIQLKLTRVADL